MKVFPVPSPCTSPPFSTALSTQIVHSLFGVDIQYPMLPIVIQSVLVELNYMHMGLASVSVPPMAWESKYSPDNTPHTELLPCPHLATRWQCDTMGSLPPAHLGDGSLVGSLWASAWEVASLKPL